MFSHTHLGATQWTHTHKLQNVGLSGISRALASLLLTFNLISSFLCLVLFIFHLLLSNISLLFYGLVSVCSGWRWQDVWIPTGHTEFVATQLVSRRCCTKTPKCVYADVLQMFFSLVSVVFSKRTIICSNCLLTRSKLQWLLRLLSVFDPNEAQIWSINCNYCILYYTVMNNRCHLVHSEKRSSSNVSLHVSWIWH